MAIKHTATNRLFEITQIMEDNTVIGRYLSQYDGMPIGPTQTVPASEFDFGRHCRRCGSVKPTGQSCGCLDNGSQ